jgi:hypothetical protein
MKSFRLAATAMLMAAAVIPLASCGSQPDADTNPYVPPASQPITSPAAADPASPGCSDDLPDTADLSAWPSWVGQDITICMPDTTSSSENDEVFNTSDYAIKVAVTGGTLTLASDPESDDLPAAIADDALTTTAATSSLLLPPGEYAALSSDPNSGGTLGFEIDSSTIAYTTAEIAADFLLENGLEASGIEGSSALEDIKDCAQSAAEDNDYSAYGSAQLDVKISDLEKQLNSCGSLNEILNAGEPAGDDDYSGDTHQEEAAKPSIFSEIEHSIDGIAKDASHDGE